MILGLKGVEEEGGEGVWITEEEAVHVEDDVRDGGFGRGHFLSGDGGRRTEGRSRQRRTNQGGGAATVLSRTITLCVTRMNGFNGAAKSGVTDGLKQLVYGLIKPSFVFKTLLCKLDTRTNKLLRKK